MLVDKYMRNAYYMSVLEYTYMEVRCIEELFKALGDENRLRILNLLRRGCLCVCELEVILGTTQSNVSRHLAKLKSENVVRSEKQAQWMYYHLHPQFVENNKLLYLYMEKEMDTMPPFTTDSSRLSTYKKSGANCENIKEMEHFIFEPR